MTFIHHAWQDRELERMARVAWDLQAKGYTPPPIAQSLTASGTFTPIVTGLYRIDELGGGGGGGGAASSLTANALLGFGGGGGAAGGTVFGYMTLVAGTGYTYTIGAAGSGGPAFSGTPPGGGGSGGTGGNTSFAGPSTLVAPGGGGGQYGGFETTATTAVLNNGLLTLVCPNPVEIGNNGVPGAANVCIRSAAGGTWGSAGTLGTGINGIFQLADHSSNNLTIDLLYGAGGTVPSGTYTASSAKVAQQNISGGVTGVGTFSIQGDEWAPGYGGPVTWIASVPLSVSAAGIGVAGLGGGGGGAGGASATGSSLGGTGGGAGSSAGGGAAGSNGASANANGTAGTAAAANSGSGGGGAGGSAAGTTGAGGAGGSGLIVITGPFPASGL